MYLLDERIDALRPRIIEAMASKEESSSLGTVARVALLLKVLAEAGGDMQLVRVAGQLNLAASSTHRLLGLLVDCGLAKKGKQPGSYRPGFEFVRLAGLVLAGSDDLIELATDFMKNVVDATEETCVLSVYMPRERKCMVGKVINGPHPLRYESQVYRVSPLPFGATGKGILAFLPDSVISEVLADGDVSPITGKPVTDSPSVRRELMRFRKQGYAITRSQRTAGAVGISAPVFDRNGNVLGALCLTIPETRFDDRKERSLAEVVMGQSHRISAALGFSRGHTDHDIARARRA